MASPTKIIVKGLKVSRGAIWWDYHLEAIAKVSGGTTKWTYHFEVKAEVSDGTIRCNYLSKGKQRYQA